MSVKVYLMAILDNYMFRPLLAIFRLSSRELKVIIYTLCARRQATVHLRCVCENWKGHVAKQNYVSLGVFNGCTGQLHVSTFTGQLQVVFKRT